MKLRISGNTIRLRLLRSEVALLRAGRPLRETLDFGAGTTLAYSLSSDSSSSVAAGFEEGTISVSLPMQHMQEWISSEQVGIYGQIALPDGGTLDVAVEKDFACLDRTDAENEDTFAHPSAGAAC